MDSQIKRHPCCKGDYVDTPRGVEFVCGYNTVIQCSECMYRSEEVSRYNRGKNPGAKANCINGGRSVQFALFPRIPNGK